MSTTGPTAMATAGTQGTVMFDSLSLQRWRQFNDVAIDLSGQMTVLTGANGSGKTTILNILSAHFGWNTPWTSVPKWYRRLLKYVPDGWLPDSDDDMPDNQASGVGFIRYSDGRECKIKIPAKINEHYNLQYDGRVDVKGIIIPSHGQPFAYQKLNDIPANPKSTAQHFQDYQAMLRHLYNPPGGAVKWSSPGLIVKSSIVSFAVFGFGNQAVASNPEFLEVFKTFEEALRNILPAAIGFQSLEVRMPEVVLKTASGEFSLDACSGGIGALVAITWQILMYSLDKESFAVAMDEPENHLHPAMQRELLPNLIKAFPNARFIICTHSPFVVTSEPNAAIYVLRHGKHSKVDSERLESTQLSSDYNETLQDVLGVPVTIPKWVEDKVSALYEEATKNGVTEESIGAFADKMTALGLYPQIPQVLEKPEDK